MIFLKDKSAISTMIEGGNILGGLLDNEILCRIVSGVSTRDIDRIIEQYIRDYSALPILKGYRVENLEYKFASCISLNDEVVHAPPSNRLLSKGDMISIDVSLKYNGYCVDAARTYVVEGEDNDLISAAKGAFLAGLSKYTIGNRLGDVSNAIQQYVEERDFKIIKDYSGHGIGRDLHEDPQVLNWGAKGVGPKIVEGLVIALEPMISESAEWTRVKADNWTAVTEDGSLSAHYENTVVALRDGPKILTVK